MLHRRHRRWLLALALALAPGARALPTRRAAGDSSAQSDSARTGLENVGTRLRMPPTPPPPPPRFPSMPVQRYVHIPRVYALPEAEKPGFASALGGVRTLGSKQWPWLMLGVSTVLLALVLGVQTDDGEEPLLLV
jgi:hypothetical protein